MVDNSDKWEESLHPEKVRTKLISAGLFLVAFEMLLDSIKRHPRSFFAERWTIDGPDLSDQYVKEILDRDPRGKQDALRGSISWLRMMDVISDADEVIIRTITDARNELAHEMTAIISGSKELSFAGHFSALMALVQKIEKWWIINVEMSVDPDFHDQEIDEDKIVSGPVWIMHMLGQVALGEGDQAWEYYNEFVRQRKDAKG